MKPHLPHHVRHGAFAGTCQACRRPLLPTDAAQSEMCSRPECATQRQMRHAAQLAKTVDDQRAAWRADTEARTAPVLQRIREELNPDDPDMVASGIAPYIDVNAVPLPAARHTEFVRHLHSVVQDSFAAIPFEEGPPPPPKADPEYAQRKADEAPELPVLDTACIACQGDCCMQGRSTHAFLTEDTINYVRWQHPDWEAEQVIETYLTHLPKTSLVESCVFHGDKGCTLGRKLRADICNSFQCGFRKALAKDHASKPGNGAVVAGIAKDHTEHPEAGAPYLRLVSMTHEGEVQVHDHLDLPALERRP